MKEYTNPICLTQQFRFCGNAFRVDTYRGCDFGCAYCFANSRKGNFKIEPAVADIGKLRKLFARVFDYGEIKDLTSELLRHRVPLHVGGMSDPFQAAEWQYHRTEQLLRLSLDYDYPLMLSSKAADMPPGCWSLARPDLHAFQCSLIGLGEDFIRRYEVKTPSPAARVAHIRKLRGLGFWVSVRLQPLIDIEQAVRLVEVCPVDYLTVEHLKLPIANSAILRQFAPERSGGHYYRPVQGMHLIVLVQIKRDNIARIKAAASCPVGVGDNDLHELSDSNCCCGLDRVGPKFDNWLRYNWTFKVTGGDLSGVWRPERPCPNGLFNSGTTGPITGTVKENVDYYCGQAERGRMARCPAANQGFLDFKCDTQPAVRTA